jgi:hypothetical protein
MFSAKEVADFLKGKGYKVGEVQEPNYYTDGYVEFDENKYIQVGEEDLILGEVIVEYDGKELHHDIGQVYSLDQLQQYLEEVSV